MKFNGLRQIEKSQTLLINEQSRGLEKQGVDVIKFGFGQSPFLPPEQIISCLKEHAHLKDYSPVQGILELREAVAAFHKQLDGIDVGAEDILIAPGSKILIYAILAAFEATDVLIPEPAWVSYVPQAQLIGHNAIPIKTNFEARWRVTPESLEKAIDQKKYSDHPTILILNYPGNPDGLTYTSTELQMIAEIAKKHQLLVVSDEIYALLHHTGNHVSLATFYPEGTIVTSGLSKWCGAGGWRLGVALLPRGMDDAFRDSLLGVASETYSCASLPIQKAAIEAYKYGSEVRQYVEAQRYVLKKIGIFCAEKLREAGVRIHNPEGGFYLFPDFTSFTEMLAERSITNSAHFCEVLLKETGVALLPGTAFGMPPENLTARLAYVDFDGEMMLKNAFTTPDLLSLSPKITDGITRIVDWLKMEKGILYGTSSSSDQRKIS